MSYAKATPRHRNMLHATSPMNSRVAARQQSREYLFSRGRSAVQLQYLL